MGPLFATPRTATVSFEVGIAPLTGDSALPLFIYSPVYFAIVILVSLYPGKLLDTVGNFLAPLKIIALVILSVAAIVWPAGSISTATEAYQNAAFSNGFVNGYLTMDTLGAMVFGIVIVNAARSRGVTEARLLTRYTVWAGLMAGVGLTLLYWRCSVWGQTARRWSISLQTALLFCMLTFSTPLAAAVASCWRR